MSTPSEKIHISEEEMNTLAGVFADCAEEAKKAGEAVNAMNAILKPEYMYDGKAKNDVAETMECMYNGLLRLGYLYDELKNFINTTTTSFKNVDMSAADAADEVVDIGTGTGKRTMEKN